MGFFNHFGKVFSCISIVIILMRTGFCTLQDKCFEVLELNRTNDNPSIRSLEDGYILNLTIGIDSAIQLLCSEAIDEQGFYTELFLANCSNLYNTSSYVPLNTSSGLNHVTENNCERSNNCKAYSITPEIEECLVLKCSRGTRNVKTCTNYITVMNIRHPPPPTKAVENGSNTIPIITGTVTVTGVVTIMLFAVVLIPLVLFLRKRCTTCRSRIRCTSGKKPEEYHVTDTKEDSPAQNTAVIEQVPTQEQEDDLSMTRSNSGLALSSREIFPRSRGIHRSASLQEGAGQISVEEELPNGLKPHQSGFGGDDEQCSSNGETSYQQETNGNQPSDTRIYPTNIYDPKKGKYILRPAESYPKKMYYITEEQQSKV